MKDSYQMSNTQLPKKKKKLIKTLAEDLNRHFSKEDLQIFHKYLERCSTSIIIRDTQIKPQGISPHTC